MYVLSELDERLRFERERTEGDVATDALDEEIENTASSIPSQHLEEYDILEVEINVCNGTFRNISGEDATATTSATTDMLPEPTFDPHL